MNIHPSILPSILSAICILTAFFHTHAAEPTEKEYKFHVGRFSSVKIQDNVNVTYHCHPDTTGIVTYRSDPDFADAFIFTNTGGTLKIQVTTEDVGKPGLPTIHIYSDTLTKAENDSDFHFEITDPAPCRTFTIDLIGNGSISASGLKADKITARVTAGMGTINLAGACNRAEYRITGTGVINAADNKAQDVICRIFGGGEIKCNAEKTLKTRGIGSTRIHYTGHPEIKHTGGGKLIQQNHQ